MMGDRKGFPTDRHVLRRSLARRDICPECGGALDTGWECNECGYDAKYEAHSKPGDPVGSAYLIALGNRPAARRVVRDPGTSEAQGR